MAKIKTQYVCQACGAAQPRWLGRCPVCDAWNTLTEETIAPKTSSGRGKRASVEPTVLADIQPDQTPRMPSGLAELDRVLGGGFVSGSTVLIGGDPGVGKSTLMLQTAAELAGAGVGVLYISAEESPGQIRLRSDRLEMKSRDMQVLGDGDADAGLAWAEKLKPGLIIVDSIQTCRKTEFDSAPGTVTQVREVASLWSDFARRTGSAVSLVGHVTKEGAVAGPRVVEHLVDAVLMFEGDNLGSVRLLRALKNRHGATGELGVFEMTGTGLSGISDPSRRFVANRDEAVAGVAVAAVVRGSRPMLIEIEALVTSSLYSSPQRNGTGVDPRRMSMWIAVLEKRVGLGLSGRDVFLNATGGVRLEDSAADLAACAAIFSSLRDKPIDQGTVLLGEVGLTGEVRAVPGMDRRLSEASHLSFKRAVIPAGYKGDVPKGLKLIPVKTLEQALDIL